MKKQIAAIIFVLLSSLAYAKPKIENINVVHIKADNVIYNKQSNSYFAQGKCEVYTDKYSLKSDKAYFEKNRSLVTLDGNILFKNKNGDWIRGSKAVFNVSEYKGFINNAVMFIKSAHLYIKARKVIIDSKDRYYINNAMATGCKCDKYLLNSKKYHPKWSIKTKHIYIVKDDYMLAYPATFKIRQIPAFFSPLMYRNLNKKRKSGFLFPSFGHSSKDGFKYAQPFFWAIDKSKDITITPFLYSNSGYGTYLDSRFYLTKNSKGEWFVTLYKEKQPYGTSKSKKLRMTIKAKGATNLEQYGIFKYDLDLVSRKNDFRVINKDNMDISSKRYTKSTAFYFVQKNEYSLGINTYFYQDLVSKNNQNTLQNLPEINFNVTNKKLWHNLTLDLQNILKNNYREKGTKGISNYTSILISYPFKISHFSILPKIGIYNTYANWKDTLTSQHKSKNILLHSYSVKVKTILNGYYFYEGNSNLLGLKHTITPYIEYQYIPKKDWSGLPDFILSYKNRNAIVTALENRVIAKFIDKDGIKYREIFYNKLSQEYDFYKEDSQDSHFGKLYEETRVSPFEFLSFSSKAHFSTKKFEFSDMDNSINITTKYTGASLGYLLKKDENYKITDKNMKLNIYAYPIKNLYLYAYLEKNIHNHYYPQKRFGFMYTEDCWGLGIDAYRNQTPKENENGVYTRRSDTGFWITITFKGLGKIKTQNKQWMKQ